MNLVESHLFLSLISLLTQAVLGQMDRPTRPGAGGRTRPGGNSGDGGVGKSNTFTGSQSSPSKQRDDSQIRCRGLDGDSKATTCSQEGLRADFPGQVLKVGY